MASELGVQTIQHTNGTDALTIDASGNVSFSGSTNVFGMETKSLSGVQYADFTIPAGTKIIWFSWHNVAPPNSTNFRIRLGTSAGLQTSSYNSELAYMYQGGNVSENGESLSFNFGNWGVDHPQFGNATISAVDTTSDIWSLTGQSALPTYDAMLWIGGTVDLSDTLTTVRVFNDGAGQGNFASGSASVIYAG